MVSDALTKNINGMKITEFTKKYYFNKKEIHTKIFIYISKINFFYINLFYTLFYFLLFNTNINM